MKALFLIVTLSLLAALEAQDPLSFPLETQDITGTWYVNAIVADNDLPKERRPRKVSPVTVTALDGGDLEIMFTFLKQGQCHEKREVMQPTEEPGKYSVYGGRKHVYIFGLPVEDHYVFYCEAQRHGKQFRAGKLLGRNPDVNQEALDAFKKFTQCKGLPQEDIFTPALMESCDPESD